MEEQKKSYYQRKKEKDRALKMAEEASRMSATELVASTQQLYQNDKSQVSILPTSPTLRPIEGVGFMEGIRLESQLETEADMTELAQQLLSITNKCIPKAVEAYEASPKKSNADALNLFISQSRELSNDLRSLQNKKAQTNKIIKECLTPAFQQIHEQMLNIPHHLKEMKIEEYEDEMKNFMSLVVRSVCEKLKEIL